MAAPTATGHKAHNPVGGVRLAGVVHVFLENPAPGVDDMEEPQSVPLRRYRAPPPADIGVVPPAALDDEDAGGMRVPVVHDSASELSDTGSIRIAILSPSRSTITHGSTCVTRPDMP